MAYGKFLFSAVENSVYTIALLQKLWYNVCVPVGSLVFSVPSELHTTYPWIIIAKSCDGAAGRIVPLIQENGSRWLEAVMQGSRLGISLRSWVGLPRSVRYPTRVPVFFAGIWVVPRSLVCLVPMYGMGIFIFLLRLCVIEIQFLL